MSLNNLILLLVIVETFVESIKTNNFSLQTGKEFLNRVNKFQLQSEVILTHTYNTCNLSLNNSLGLCVLKKRNYSIMTRETNENLPLNIHLCKVPF